MIRKILNTARCFSTAPAKQYHENVTRNYRIPMVITFEESSKTYNVQASVGRTIFHVIQQAKLGEINHTRFGISSNC